MVASSTGRLHELDSIRTIAIVSMTFGHVANYSFLWLISHPVITVWDGASLFVLVSGIVVGLVYRSRIEKYGMAASAKKLLRRAGFLYLAQLALVTLALTIAYTLPSAGADQFRLPGVDSLPTAIGWALVLGANPIYVNFLSLYVVLLIAVIPMLYLLQHSRRLLATVLLVGLYVLGLQFPQAFTLPNGSQGKSGFDMATWFVMFATGVWAGWVWRQRRADERLMSRRVLWIGVPGLVLFAAAALFITVADTSYVDWWRDKGLMAPLRFAAAWVFFAGCYWLIRLVDRLPRGSRLTDQMAVLGARSLDAVVILTLVTILSQGLLGLDSATRPAQLLAIATVIAAWLWARYRARVMVKV